ncbi:MAG: hypothetical protein HeimC2_44670 [Candidatus Heimdallarchaeota archaeon LC_2]|nr:MAG: hypothetical protein HeimC2_44670 [Candidatus Heimdallarchaeota archaeon LC_2]
MVEKSTKRLMVSSLGLSIISLLYLIIIIDIHQFKPEDWIFTDEYTVRNKTLFITQYESHCQYLELSKIGVICIFALPVFFSILFPFFQYSLIESKINAFLKNLLRILFYTIHLFSPILISFLVFSKDNSTWGISTVATITEFRTIGILILICMLGMTQIQNIDNPSNKLNLYYEKYSLIKYISAAVYLGIILQQNTIGLCA